MIRCKSLESMYLITVSLVLLCIFFIPSNAFSENIVDINIASRETLQELPGIGRRYSTKIIEYRKKHGSFEKFSQLTEIPGIGPRMLSKFKGKIKIGKTIYGQNQEARTNAKAPGKELININTASRGTLRDLPGLGPVTSQNIVEYREMHGYFAHIDEIRNVVGIGPVLTRKISSLITTEEIKKVTEPEPKKLTPREKLSQTEPGKFFLDRVEKYQKAADELVLDSETIRLELLKDFKQEEDDFFALLKNHLVGAGGLEKLQEKIGADTFEFHVAPEEPWGAGIDFYFKISPPFVIYQFSLAPQARISPHTNLRPAQLVKFDENQAKRISFPERWHLAKARAPYYHFQLEAGHGFYAASGPWGSGSFYNHMYYVLKNGNLEFVERKNWMSSPTHSVNEKQKTVTIVSLRKTPASIPWYKDYRERCQITFQMNSGFEKVGEVCESIKDDGRTALHGSAARGDTEELRMFIDEFDVNVKDENGQTPLHLASIWGAKKSVKFLLKKGADPGLKDNQGKTPLDLAKTLNKQEVIDLLEKNKR